MRQRPMHPAGTPTPSKLTIPAAAVVLFAALPAALATSTGCRTEGKTPPLFTGTERVDPSSEEAAPRPTDTDPDTDPAIPEAHRDLWFARGPGRQAILARERRDYTGAAELLAAVVADPSASADERGGALWLLGLEDLRQGDHLSAAQRFEAARAAPGLAPVDVHLRLLQGQALLDAGQPAEALAVLEGGPHSGPLAGDALIANADARQRTGDRLGAIALYDRFLANNPKAARRHEARIKLARLLADAGADRAKSPTGPTGPDHAASPERSDDLRRALGLYESLLLEVPLSAYGEEAAAALPELQKRLGGPRSLGAELEATRLRALARLHELLARGRYAALIAEADAFLRGRKLAAGDRCEALYLWGSAVFKQRKRAEARIKFDKAAAECKRAGALDTEVKARYQAARGRYAAGEFTRAAEEFERLARDYPGHSYADDAYLLAGESWAQAKRPTDEREAYAKAWAIGGDMAAEARRRLIIGALVDGDHGRALELTDRGIAEGEADPIERAKLHYYRGRALAGLGRAADAEAAWLAAIRPAPLSYPALLALSRLRDAGEPSLARGLAILEGHGQDPNDPSQNPNQNPPRDGAAALTLPTAPAARRARILASLGLGAEAQGELREAAIGGWPAASILAQAGLYAESQRLIGGLGRGWRANPPVGERRQLWELAHPLAFEEVIRSGEGSHQVPNLLTFAIMQTESRFDPGATSWAGARGLIQLMPATAKEVAKRAGIAKLSPDDLYDPAFNLDLGMRYLGGLVGRFGGGDEVVPLAIPSYNAGPGAVDRWLKSQGDRDFDLFIESIPYDETRKYTQSVLERWMIYRWIYDAKAPAAERLPYVPLAIPGSGGA